MVASEKKESVLDFNFYSDRKILIKLLSKKSQMQKLLGKLTVFVILVYSIECQCKDKNQFSLPSLVFGKCAQSCQDPIYQKCPSTGYDPFPMPEYCGLTAANIWANFTFTCQICGPGTNNRGYYFGPCNCQNIQCFRGEHCVNGNCVAEDSCNIRNCQSGYECIQNQCIRTVNQVGCIYNSDCLSSQICEQKKCRIKTCSDIVCDTLETCQKGVCIRKYDYFCSYVTSKIERQYCPTKRPSISDCFSSNSYNAIPTTICGVSSEGGFLLDYQNHCQACTKQFISYTYNISCSEVPPICNLKTQKCIDFQCVTINLCNYIRCREGFVCNQQGICIEESACNCAEGFRCQGSTCVPIDLCEQVICSQGLICKQGQCVHPCSLIICGQGTICQSGKCIPLPQPGDLKVKCPNLPCPNGYTCINSITCISTNENVSCQTNKDCSPSTICIGSSCQILPCSSTSQCYGAGECTNGICSNKTPKS